MTAIALNTINIDTVWHVGSMNPEDAKKPSASMEGFCLSVSVDPEEWGSIARVAGDCWELTRNGGRFVDACNLGDEAEAAVLSWAIERGYAEPTTWHRSWFYDGEADDWAYLQFDTLEEAEDNTDDDDLEYGAPPTDDEELVESVGGFRMTASGMAALGRWHSESDVEYGALLLYVQEVVAPADSDIMGVWWNEEFNPDALSAPRGGILPERLAEFSRELGGPDDGMSL